MSITPVAPVLSDINTLMNAGFRKFDIVNEDIRQILEDNRLYPYDWNKHTWTNIPFILDVDKFGGATANYVRECNAEVNPNEIYIYLDEVVGVIFIVTKVKCVSSYTKEVTYKWKNELYTRGSITCAFDTLDMILEKLNSAI
jgi:hypothetical protein